MIALAAALLQAAAPAAVFAPPLDRPLRVTTTQTRSGNGPSFAFRMTRELRFSRLGAGYAAELTITAVEGDAPRPAVAIFETALGALAGRPIRFLLDARGAVTGVADREALWTALCDGLARAAADGRPLGRERAETLARLAAPLRALPAERQQAMLASMLSGLIAAQAAAEQPGDGTAVTLPGRSLHGSESLIDASRRVTREGALLRVEIGGQGPVAGGAAQQVEIAMLVDPTTGLVRETRKTVRSRLVDGAEATSVTRTWIE